MFGRDRERARLKAAIEDADTPVIRIAGPSGAGKTALVEAVLAEMGRGLLIGTGKYPQGDGRNGFAPILAALSQAVEQALDLLYDPQAGLETLSRAVGPGFDLLTRTGFDALGALEGQGAESAARRDEAIGVQASAARLVDAMLRVVGWLNGFGATTVLFIDDWQRAPPEAHALAAALARDRRHPFCTLILAERDGEAAAPLDALRLEAPVLVVGDLAPEARRALLSAALGDAAAGAVADAWLGEASGALPLGLLEAARALSESGALAERAGRWEIDDARAAAIDRGDFTATMLRRARELAPAARRFGQALALWGDRARLDVLASALAVTEAEALVQARALEAAGIVRREGDEAAFRHDRLRASLLDCAPPAALAELAGEMAQRLVRADDDLAWRGLRKAVLQLRLAGGLADAAPGLWRRRFAEGARTARTVADIAASVAFAEAAWTLAGREPAGDPGEARLILREAALAAAARKEAGLVADRVRRLVAVAGDEDTALSEAYDLAISATRMVGDIEAAWALARQSLQRLGIRLPEKPGMGHVLAAAAQWRFWLSARPTPPAGEGRPGAASALARAGNSAGILAFEKNPILALLIGLLTSARAHRLGDPDPFWRTTDTFLAASLGDFERAARLGSTCIEDAAAAGFARGCCLYRSAFFGAIWNRSLVQMPALCEQAYDLAMSEGDLVNAGYAIRNRILLDWRLSPELPPLLEKFREIEDIVERLGDPSILSGLRLTTGTIRQIMQPGGLAVAPDAEAATPAGGTAIPVVRIEVLALAGDWAEIVRYADEMRPRRVGWNSHPGGVVWRYYENLARLKLGLAANRPDLRYIGRAARLNPIDHAPKLVVLRAEALRQQGRAQPCLAAYAQAVETLAAGGSRLDAGVAAECAQAAAQAFGDHPAAERYGRIARDIWIAWGARSKISGDLDAAGASAAVLQAQSEAALARKADRAKSRFLADVSHELRTPMQSIQTLLELAADDPSSVDLAGLRDAFGSLREVIDDLTDLGAQSGDGGALRLGPVDLAQLIGEEMRLVGPAAAARGLKLEARLDAALPPAVLTDAARVRQVLRNLFSNAVKYVEHGQIIARLEALPLGGERLQVQIAIEDTGPGLSEAQRRLIFEPFERGGREEPGGLGLGLTISRRIAERLGGRLEADNRPEGGARFLFEFPAEASAVLPAPLPAGLPPLRVMIVDDVALIRRSFAAVLRRDGHTAIEAGTVAEAIEHCRDPLDLVLLDLGLPDGDGLEVIEALRAHCGEDGRAAPVLVLTGSTDPARAEAARAAGAARVLFKPVSAGELNGAIREVLGRAAPVPAGEAGFQAELARLSEEARQELGRRGADLLAAAETSPSPGLAAEAHRLAGLAAQFEQAALAAAFDALEAALKAGLPCDAPCRTLEQLLAAAG